jgi:tetratricopeptide (TPR) repeat protein
VRQPHNLPLQLLAEDGIVGALLAGGALIALLAAALARVRELAAAGPERERDALLALACVAAGLAWLVHGLIDWDWDIPGVTIPALALLGVAAAVPVGAPPANTRRPGPLALVALGAVTVALCAFGASAILPAWSQSKDRHAIGVAAASSDPARLTAAAADADLAARLNPLATAPLTDAATIAANRSLQAQARGYLVEAVRRAPYDATAWSRLALAALDLGDRAGAHSAALRALSLDPVNAAFAGIAAETELLLAAPQDSATATGTPLPEPPPAVAPALSRAGLTVLPAPTPAPPAATVPRR